VQNLQKHKKCNTNGKEPQKSSKTGEQKKEALLYLIPTKTAKIKYLVFDKKVETHLVLTLKKI
jgi:hypothetical protein